jgi:hypothetical protein
VSTNKAQALFDRVRTLAAQGKLDDYQRDPLVTNIPEPGTTLDTLRDSVVALKQAVMQLQGLGTTPLDEALTLRDFLQAKVFSIEAGAQTIGTGSGFFVQGGGVDIGQVSFDNDFFGNPTLSVAPTPTALTANGTYRAVVLTWNIIDYANHAYTEIWRNTTNNLGSATQIGTSPGLIYVDEASIALGVTYYYWIRAVATVSGSPVQGSFNSTTGTPGGAGLIANADLGALIVQAANLAAASVQSVNLAANSIAVGTAAIQNGAIANAMLGTAIVDTANIVDAAVSSAKILDAAITSAKIGTAQITNAKLATAAVGTANIQDAAITNAKVNDLSADKLTAGTVSASRIGAATITADKLNVTSLDAISATIGLLRTASSGARLEIASDVIRVYDSGGVVRIKLGNLA